MLELSHFRLVGTIQIGSCVLMIYIYIYLLPFLLAQKDVPGSVHMFPTPKVERVLSPRRPGSFQWEIVFRNYTLLPALFAI